VLKYVSLKVAHDMAWCTQLQPAKQQDTYWASWCRCLSPFCQQRTSSTMVTSSCSH